VVVRGSETFDGSKTSYERRIQKIGTRLNSIRRLHKVWAYDRMKNKMAKKDTSIDDALRAGIKNALTLLAMEERTELLSAVLEQSKFGIKDVGKR
jgi:hypothetical protein